MAQVRTNRYPRITVYTARTDPVELPSRCRFLELLPSVVHKILSNVVDSVGHFEVLPTYQTLSLVCSTFRTFARPRLLETITINTSKRLEDIIEWHLINRHLKDAVMVRILRFDLVHLRGESRGIYVTQERVARLLEFTTELRGLHFGRFTSLYLNGTLRHSLGNLKHLTTLSFEIYEGSSPYSEILTSVRSLPKLSTLILDDRCYGFQAELEVKAPIIRLVCKPALFRGYTDWSLVLQKANLVRYLDIDGHSPTQQDVIKHIPGSVIALRICGDPAAADRLYMPFEGTFGNVLALAVNSDRVALPYPKLFPNLETLVVYNSSNWLPNSFREFFRWNRVKHLVLVFAASPNLGPGSICHKALLAGTARGVKVSWCDFEEVDLSSLAEGNPEVKRMQGPEMRWLPLSSRRYTSVSSGR